MLLYDSKENSFYTKIDKERKYKKDIGHNYRQGHRDAFERDYGRILHSAAFRRLQGKTQVLGPGEGDFHRTRLTHTLEVSQIARGITIQLNETSSYLKNKNNKIDLSLIEAAALSHDLGHPPFGHQGERALHECMLEFNQGFEGNAHTFRLLTRLEKTGNQGLDLTRGTLLATLKYPIILQDAEISAVYGKAIRKAPPKSSIFEEDKETFNWLLKEFNSLDKSYLMDVSHENQDKTKHIKTINKTVECSIIELADDIAYATHDLEDALSFHLITLDDFKKELENYNFAGMDAIVKKTQRLHLNDKEYKANLKDLFADIIHVFMKNIELEINENLESTRLQYKATLKKEFNGLLENLKELVKNKVIKSQRVQTMEWKGGKIVKKLFEALYEDKKLLPMRKRNNEDTNNLNGISHERVVCDYIAGMTDKYAENFYSRLYESEGGRLFDI